MSFDAAFLSLMSATVTITPASTRDAYLKTTYGTAVADIPAKVSYVTKRVRVSDTETIAVTATVHLPPPGYVANGVTVPTVTTHSKVLLPDGTTRYVEQVDMPVDEDGSVHHAKLSLTG